MKKNRIAAGVLLAVMVFSLSLPSALADTQKTEPPVPEVRVNGHLVEFPDAQPYYNEDDRTMIPVRFVTEALGADVSWSKLRKGAIMQAVVDEPRIPCL